MADENADPEQEGRNVGALSPTPAEKTSNTKIHARRAAKNKKKVGRKREPIRFPEKVIAAASVAGVLVAAIYTWDACRMLDAMHEANVTSERQWRDSRRAFLEFAKPVFGELDENGKLIQTPTPKPVMWHVGLINRGVITCPNYTVEQVCVAALAEEPRAVPCRKVRTVNRPINPGEKETIEPGWESGDEPSAETLGAVARGEKNIYVFAVVSYDDGLGGTWARTGCWFFTKKNEFGELVRDPTFHFIWPCRVLNTPEERRRQKKG